MELQLSDDFVKDNELNENQVKAIKGLVDGEFLPTIKKEWDGVANANAEKILDGAGKRAKELLGVDFEREQGEKVADYIVRATKAKFEGLNTELANKQKEIDEKLKNFKGGDEFKAQLDSLKAEKDTLLQQVAEMETYKEKAQKADEYSEQLSGLKLSVAFNEVKPNFPETVNPYEAKAKWDEFKNDVLSKYTIEIVEGKAIAVDKENQYKQTPLSELVAKNENITSLLNGRQQGGTGAQPKDLMAVEGVPFKVPKGADSETKSRLVREYLNAEKVAFESPEYSKKFQELFSKISKVA